jgi:aspartyl-tRNA(Asn)/glutamyl-tRNA(Gln) amidotransferase subunit C
VTESGLNEELVKKLARLARLALDDAEVRALVPELSAVVRHVDALRSVNTEGVPPMTHGAPIVDEEPPHPPAPSLEDGRGGAAVLGRRAIEQSAGYDVDDGMVKVPRVVE